jgi:DNA repair exonuclease SbcCD ATPase subunit
MFGKSGISSMMIENALEEIEGQVNYILEQLGTDHRLKFDPERSLKRLSRTCFECGEVFGEGSKEKFCPECGVARQNERSDELRPMIVENGRKQAFELDSGAGRALVALATRAAMSRFLGASVLFLDEVSGALDDYHLTLLIRLLHKLPSMGFKQVFVISHQKEVDATSPIQIVVSKIQEEGRSTVTL